MGGPDEKADKSYVHEGIVLRPSRVIVVRQNPKNG
jgi:hypothetical protein